MKSANHSHWRYAPAATLACALALAAMPAFAGDRKARDDSSSPATLYHNYCSVCHGDRGDGQSRATGSFKAPPRDFTSAASLAELSRARMILATREGRPGTAMVGWKSQLSDRQIEAVVDYVRETFMRASSADDASRGRQVYARTCAVCHGDRGAGSSWASANLKPPPRDFSAAAAKAELSRERMLAAVTHGRPGTAMTGFASQLAAEDIAAVVDYIRSGFMMIGSDAGISGTHAQGRPVPAAAAPAAMAKASVTPAAAKAPAAAAVGAATPAAAAANGHAHHAGSAPGAAAAAPAASAPKGHAHHAGSAPANMNLPLPFKLAGDAGKGKTFYDGNCATCHGKLGDGQGPRAYFINPKPQSFISAESRAALNRPAIFEAVAEGRLRSEMPAWDKVLTRQQIANVSEYVFRAFIQQGGAMPKRSEPAPQTPR